jgi:hypothetical protein
MMGLEGKKKKWEQLEAFKYLLSLSQGCPSPDLKQVRSAFF